MQYRLTYISNPKFTFSQFRSFMWTLYVKIVLINKIFALTNVYYYYNLYNNISSVVAEGSDD